MNRRNVKGGRRQYINVGHRAKEDTCHKGSESSTSRKFSTYDNRGSDYFGRNVACGNGGDNIENVERSYDSSKKDKKESLEEHLPSSTDPESTVVFCTDVRLSNEERVRIDDAVDKQTKRFNDFTDEWRTQGRSPVHIPLGRRRNTHQKNLTRDIVCSKRRISPPEYVEIQDYSTDANVRQIGSSKSIHKHKPPDVINSEDTCKLETSTFENNNIHNKRGLSEHPVFWPNSADPDVIVSKCSSKITRWADSCLANHGKEVGKISLCINSTKCSDNILNILSNRKMNMLSQQMCFNSFIQSVHNDVRELYNESNSDIVTKKTKEVLSFTEYECNLFSKMLPAYSLREKLKTTLTKRQVTIISCDSAYQGNIVVPLLLQSIFRPDMITSCEVNEAVAVYSAHECCCLMDEKLGQLVGYDTGKEIMRSEKNTKIVYTTIQELFSYSLNDPLLSKYSCIILNDLLYRSIEADILLASLRECLNKRDDLKLVILTATEHNLEKQKCFFSRKCKDSVSVINTDNLNFPVQTVWKQSFCNPDDDHTAEAVDLCFSIHVLKMNEEGNVLVFLPSEEDALKVMELTMQKFSEYSFTDVFCTHVNEKSKVKKLFWIWKQQQSKRIIIFVNSSFEAILFPNVHYVVDLGRTCQISYDTEKKIELQKMSFISRSRSEIRKKYAGTHTPGVCFRMYSKKNYKKSMVPNEPSEVLSRSPLNSLVKIFKYRSESALAAEFVEPLPQKVKENALSSLQHLGVLENGKLTDLGEHLVKLPFPPEYSKLIMLGKQRNLLFEVIILVSFFLIKSDDVFQNKSTKDLKKKVDAVKLHFLRNDSDTLTILNIYRQWAASGYCESWCTNNYIEFGFLDCVRTKVTEVCEITKKILRVVVSDTFSSDYQITPDIYSSLQQVIFECFRGNLCVYSGHFASGYRSLTAQCTAFLHPSSLISESRRPPQFIVYNKFISKARNFITHITAIPDLFVTDAFDHGLLKVKHDALFRQQYVPHVIDPVGLSVIKCALTKEKLRDLEAEIKKETKSEYVIIEPSQEKGSVTVYCLPDSWEKAEKIMRKFLNENADKFWDEKETRIIELQKGDSKVPFNIGWSRGAEITSVEVICNQDTTLDCQSDSSHDAIALPESNATRNCILLMWLRRPCVGDGYVEFSSFKEFSKARKLATKTIKVKGTSAEVGVVPHEKYRLSIHGLDPETTEEDLKTAFQKKFSGMPPSDVKIRRLLPFKSASDDIEAIKESFRAQLHNIFNKNVIEIEIHKPENDEDVTMTAEARPVGALNMYSLENLAACMNGLLEVCGTSVKARVSYFSYLFCSTDVWDKMQVCIYNAYNAFIQNLKNKSQSCDIGATTVDSETQRLKISSENERNMTELRNIIQKLLEGRVITSTDNNCLPMLFCHGGQVFLHALKKKYNIYITDDHRTKTIRLYGTEENCRIAKEDVMEFLRKVEKETMKIMNFDCGENSRTLLKNIIQKYDVELKKFIEDCELRSAELDIQKCELILCGSSESIEKAESLLEELEESGPNCAPVTPSDKEICIICSYSVFTLAIRLESCGHTYCKTCCVQIVDAAKTFPLRCLITKCGNPIILEDIRRILDYDAEKITALLRRSLEYFLIGNEDFISCPAPNCSMFVDRKKISDTKWNCPLCHNDICFNCEVIYHDGFNCDVYQGTKKNSTYQFKVWEEENKACKQCPNCGITIQKNGGCRHMTCVKCKYDFCWICLNFYNFNHVCRITEDK